MAMIRYAVLIGLIAMLSACGGSKFRTYNGPEVTRVIVDKGNRRMHLLHHKKVLKSYRVQLGFTPLGHKQFEGDGKTPEGNYFIDRRNPNSDFHLSLGISYPNAKDIARARALGKSPGGDIFIHGKPNKRKGTGPDWTAGCISVKNRQIERIFAMVKNGTPITLHP